MSSEDKKIKFFTRRDGFILLIVWNVVLTISIVMLFVLGAVNLDESRNNDDVHQRTNEDLIKRVYSFEEKVQQQ